MPEYSQPREGFGSHTNHGEVRAVQANRPAQHGRVAREFVLPEVRPEHHHGITTGHLIFVIPKTAPSPRLHAKYVEVVTGNHHPAPDPWRGSGFGTEADSLHICVGDHAVVALRFAADVQVFAIGEIVEITIVCNARQSNHAARMRHGVGPKNQRIDHTESRRGHPDAQR